MTHDTAPLLCGTRAGYIRHVKAGEPACDDCRAAHTLYMRLYRARGGHAYDSARQRALSRLARMHPTEYRALVAEERQNDGKT